MSMPTSSEMSAVGQHEHAIGEQQRLVDVVGDEQHRRPVAATQLLDQRVHPDPGERIQRTERLVKQQQLRLADQRPSQRGPLRLAAGQRLGPVVLVAVEPDLGERLPAPRHAAAAPLCPRTTLSSTDAQGSSRGSWKTTDRCCGHEDVTARLRESRPARARSSVVLPEPLRPSSATNSPGATSRSMPVQHLAVAEREGPGDARGPEASSRRRRLVRSTRRSASGCHRSSLLSRRRISAVGERPSTA